MTNDIVNPLNTTERLINNIYGYHEPLKNSFLVLMFKFNIKEKLLPAVLTHVIKRPRPENKNGTDQSRSLGAPGNNNLTT